jgi:hypothetical protein
LVGEQPVTTRPSRKRDAIDQFRLLNHDQGSEREKKRVVLLKFFWQHTCWAELHLKVSAGGSSEGGMNGDLPACTASNTNSSDRGAVGSHKALEVANINMEEVENKAGLFVDRLGILSLVAAIDLAIVALADLVVSTVAVAPRSGSGEEEEGGDGGDGEDASEHGVKITVGWLGCKEQLLNEE